MSKSGKSQNMPQKGARKPFRYRNHVACNPLLKKGGVHEKSTSSKRGTAKRKLKKEAMNWQSDSSLSSLMSRVMTAWQQLLRTAPPIPVI